MVFGASTPVKPCGKSVNITSALSGTVKKMNIRVLWTHALVAFIALILLLLVRGVAVYVLYVIVLSAAINLLHYFVLFLFPAYTLASVQRMKKSN